MKRALSATTSPLVQWAVETSLDWAHDAILHWDNLLPHDVWLTFVTREDIARVPVDISRVVGQWDHFAGSTWLTALTASAPKMQRAIQQFDENPEYYLPNIEKCDMWLCTADDGMTWYSRTGNHRCVVAKFGFAKTGMGTDGLLHGAATTRYKVEWAALECYRALKGMIDELELPISCTLTSTVPPANGAPRNWSIFVTDRRFGRERKQHLNSTEFCRYVESVITNKGKLPLTAKAQDVWRRIANPADNKIIFPP